SGSSRGARAARIWPNVSAGVLHVVRLTVHVLSRPAACGSASHCVWLNALIASARNWTRCVRLNVQFFEIDRSVWLRPGWRNSARRELPNVPAAAGAYALGLNQKRFPVCAPAAGSATMFGRPPRRKPLVLSEMRGIG